MIPSEYTLEFYKDAVLEWRWRLVHANGNVVADSGEGYKNRGDCEAEAFKLFPSEQGPPDPERAAAVAELHDSLPAGDGE